MAEEQGGVIHATVPIYYILFSKTSAEWRAIFKKARITVTNSVWAFQSDPKPNLPRSRDSPGKNSFCM